MLRLSKMKNTVFRPIFRGYISSETSMMLILATRGQHTSYFFRKKEKKKFDPGPPQSPLLLGPSDPKSDALPLSYEGNGENCKN